MKKLSPDELVAIRERIAKLSNSARYDEARKLCAQLTRNYPDNIEFPFLEAVYAAENEAGLTPQQVSKRHACAAAKIRALFPRIRSVDATVRRKMRNEYYWFSHQPKKQYALGLEKHDGPRARGFYSQGVGAAEVAKAYALAGKRGLCIRWAKLSEKAWKKFFKDRPDWFNAYFFYAQSLGYQGRFEEMDLALQNAALRADKPKSWQACKQIRAEIMTAYEASVTKTRK